MGLSRSVSTIVSGLVAGSMLVSCAAGPTGPTPTPVIIVVTATPAPAATPSPLSSSAGAAAVEQPSPTPAPTKAAASLLPTASPAAESLLPTATTAAQIGGGVSDVSALYVMSDGKQYSGGTSKVHIAVDKGTQTDLQVGFFESEVGGSGPEWQAAGWMAVIMSSFLLGVDPTAYRYSYTVGGRIDGPSAGALMTVATIAAMLGTKIQDGVAMTGTINPDGTIGPVGGIPHKIDGAAAAKIKTVLIPAGQRFSLDENTNQNVDVIDRGKRVGVDVKEVSDIYAAYELLTGKPLPKPLGMQAVTPDLPATAFDRVKSKTKEWISRYVQLNRQYQSLPEKLRTDGANNLMTEAAAEAKRADSLYGQGLPSAAYSQAVTATLKATIAYQSTKVIESYLMGGDQGAINYLKSMQTVSLKIDALSDRLQTQSAGSLSDVLTISEAYGNVNIALGLTSLADGALQKKAATEQEALVNLTEATLWYAVADESVEVAKDSLDVGMGYGKGSVPKQAQVESLAELFRRAAEANLNYFDNVVLGEVAKGMGVRTEALKTSFAGQDLQYNLAVSSLQAMATLKTKAGGGMSGAYATLGGSVNSYVMSSILVSKFYSLGAQLDKSGNLVGVQNERAMINALDFAEQRSKEFIGLDIAVNGDAVQPILNYDNGKVSREGSLDDKFTALADYWTASLEGEIVGILSGRGTVLR